MRKHTRRRLVVPMPPPGLRPKLAPSQVQDLALVHIANLDALAKGGGDDELLWQWVAGAYTWSEIAGAMHRRSSEQLAEAGAAMAAQLDACSSVLERYRRTGRVGLSGPELQVAREACGWMDALAEAVDLPTAIAAAEASEARINRMAASPQPIGARP